MTGTRARPVLAALALAFVLAGCGVKSDPLPVDPAAPAPPAEEGTKR